MLMAFDSEFASKYDCGQIKQIGGSVIMSNKTITISSLAMGIIAIVTGVMVIFWWHIAQFILGIFLIVWGVLSILNK